MNAVSKIIYDRLASGDGIFLPGIGSLYVEREPAQFVARNEIKPPHCRVAYTPESLPWLKSAVDILAGTYRTTIIAAELQYAAWREDVADGKNFVEINGVGVIKNGLFYPSVELFQRLNNSGNNNMVLHSPFRPDWLLVAISAFVIIGLFCLIIALHCCSHSCSRHYEKRIERVVIVDGDEITPEDLYGDENGLPYGEEENLPNDDTAGESAGHEAVPGALSGKSSGTVAHKEQATMPYSVPEITSQGGRAANNREQTAVNVAVPVYYVVIGVFNSRENAEKCVASDPFFIGRRNYKIYHYKDGKYLVSAFESTDKSKAEGHSRELGYYQWDVWVYEGNLTGY